MAKQKFYVVWEGNAPGIYLTWDECKKQVSGYSGARFKSFPTRAEAEAAYKNGIEQSAEQEGGEETAEAKGWQSRFEYMQETDRPILPALSVDAACSGNPGKMEYRGVLLLPDSDECTEVFHSPIYNEGTNNIGEFLAIVDALMMLKQQNSYLPIYSDSKTAQSWVRRKLCCSKLKRTERNADLFKRVDEAEQWLHANNFFTSILKWRTEIWGEIPADFGRK